MQLEEQQRAQAVTAEKRELNLAEKEREQATVLHELREEKKHLESQRRAAALLLRSLLQSRNQNGAPKGSCVEMEIGDTSSQEEETAGEDVNERSDIDDEVWNLDWNTLTSKSGRRRRRTPTPKPTRSLRECSATSEMSGTSETSVSNETEEDDESSSMD